MDVAHSSVFFLLLHLVALFPLLAHGQYPSSNFSFASFPASSSPASFIYSGSAHITDAGRIDLTTANSGTHPAAQTSCGRALYSHVIRLWEPATKDVASFSTSFNFVIGNLSANASGDGLAFVMAGQNALGSSCSGKWLGLFNRTSTSGSIVAVELDTFKNSFDPDDNHVGIDVNSIVSVATHNFSKSSMNLKGGQPISVWVDYDGLARKLSVFAAFAHFAKPVANPVLSYSIDLTNVLPETVYMGFSASTNSSFEIHQILTWSFSSWGLPVQTQTTRQTSPDNLAPAASKGGKRSKGSLIAGLFLGILATLGAVAAFVIARKQRAELGGQTTWDRSQYTRWEQVSSVQKNASDRDEHF